MMLAVLSVRPARAVECDMSRAFQQPDKSVRSGKTDVWADASASALFFVEALNVNTDGTRRSYSVEDFWGEARALNNLCNAMSDGCASLNRAQKRERKLLTQQALADGWPAEALAKTKLSPSIIPMKDGKPCPLVDGFLVSATALHKPRITDVCDIASYVDALTVPALVLPKNPRGGQSGFTVRNAKVGDLAAVMVPSGDYPVFAVVGDIGPVDELGEGSVALNGKLLGRSNMPGNYKDATRNWVVPLALVVIFPGTRDAADPYLTTDRIDAAAKRRFEEWGGVLRLAKCANAYGS
jgi:hypothetical protein